MNPEQPSFQNKKPCYKPFTPLQTTYTLKVVDIILTKSTFLQYIIRLEAAFYVRR